MAAVFKTWEKGIRFISVCPYFEYVFCLVRLKYCVCTAVKQSVFCYPLYWRRNFLTVVYGLSKNIFDAYSRISDVAYGFLGCNPAFRASLSGTP